MASVLDGAADEDVMYEYLHHSWELHQFPTTGVLGAAEPGNDACPFADDGGGWAANTAGVSSSSSSSSPVTFHADEHRAAFSFEGGGGSGDATAATNKRPRAHAASQDGAREEEEDDDDDATITKKQCGGGGGKTAATKRAKAAATGTPPKEPQRSTAKNRRERVNERLKVLQELVPNGRKLDTVTMLDRAITYVKFMQLQLKVLETDAFWPAQGGKAPEMSQVREALNAILLSASSSSQSTI